MTRRLVVMLAGLSTMLGIAVGAAGGGAAATLPPDDTIGTDFVRRQAEAAAAEYFTTTDPSITNVACVAPATDSSGVEMVCYATSGSGAIVTATARINDYGEIEMTDAGTAPTPPPTTPTPSSVLAAYSGEGSAARPVDPITAPTIVHVTHSGGSDFAVQPQHGGVAVGAPLVSTTGTADGRYLVGLGGTISAFAITADGAWTLELHAIASAVPLAAGTPATGATPDVVAYSAAGTATVEYTGTAPIVVRAVTSGGPTVIVDEAAAFTGEVTLPPGPGQLLVDAAGPWTIALPAPPPTTVAPTTAAPTTVASTTVAPAPTTATAAPTAVPSVAPTTAPAG